MDIGEAVYQLKSGYKVARSGWNGKGMYLFMRFEEGVSIEDTIANGGANEETVENDGADYVVMKTADNKVVPWLCSQTDLLAQDWTTVE